jgi:ribosomal protein S18 acetylase RimI-like enzyme
VRPPRRARHLSAVRLLDEVAANATPAPITRLVDGWLAKSAPALPFRRANAVLPAEDAGRDPDRAGAVVDELAGWYRHQGSRLVIQVPSTDPALDALLAARGLAVEAPVDVLVAPLAGLPGDPAAGSAGRPVAVTTAIGADEGWARRYGEVHGDDATSRDRVTAYGRMLADLGPAVVTAVGHLGGEPVGLGFGVVERGWLGVFGMGTAPSARRRGVARSVLAALAGGGAPIGADHAYLQVEVDNAPAQALYRGLGFTESHRYHYRVLEL